MLKILLREIAATRDEKHNHQCKAVFIARCVLVVIRYTFSAFTTGSALVIRRASLF